MARFRSVAHVAFAVSPIVNNVITVAPWTLDMCRWYAWRQIVVVATLAALVFWGFRNVFGKQPAFPAGVLDG